MNRSPWLVAVIGCLIAVGCAKQVSQPDLKFGAQQRVVLSFRGGEQVRGKIDTGSHVELREPGVVWTAQVGEITDDKIVLKHLTRVSDDRGMVMPLARAEDARFAITGPVPDKTLLRNEITGVDLLKVDGGRTARTVTFWSYGAVVLAILLGERS